MIDSGGGYVDVKKAREGPEETLVAWTSHPLFHVTPKTGRRTQMSSRLDTSQSLIQDKIVTGRADLSLYEPPMPDIKELIDGFRRSLVPPQEYNSYNDAHLILHLYGDSVPPLGLPYAIPECRLQEECPEDVFIEYQRPRPPIKEFKNGMGFDLYIDSGRFYPECCVASKVHVRLYDEKYREISGDIETEFNLDTTSTAPEYNLRYEFRDPAYDPTATLLFTITLIDSLDQKVTRLGLAVLPVFVKPGTFVRPSIDCNRFCLNEGAFQLRLHRRRVEKDILTEKSVDGIVPCSSLLVRIVSAACHQDGEAKKASEFPKDEWEQEGLIQPKPLYTDGVYESVTCIPTISECRIYHSFRIVQPVAVRKATRAIADARKGKTDQGLMEWLQTKFRGHLSSDVFDLSCLTKYNNDYGIAFSVERCQNLPWNGFTYATYCLSPPASFYRGSLEDPAVLVTKLDLEGTIRQPKWKDGSKIFPRRQYHTNLIVLVQLYEMVLDTRNEGQVNVGQQAWTLLPVCSGHYSNYGLFQVGLFQGPPSETLIESLLNGNLEQTIANLRKKRTIRLMDSASVYVRMGDARRKEELEKEKFINRRFLPRGNKYINEIQSKPLRSIIPSGQTMDNFSRHLTTKFVTHIQRTFDARLRGQKT